MLKLENIKKTFNPGTVNEKCALQGLSLHLKPGDFATIIGSNGAGKSTMMNAIADVCFIPRKIHLDKPAVVMELKWDRTAEGAIKQIKEKQYVNALKEYQGNLLLVGINYEKDTKKHTCVIEQINKKL